MPSTPNEQRLELRMQRELRRRLTAVAAKTGDSLNDTAVKLLCKALKLPPTRGLVEPGRRGPKPKPPP